MTRVRRGLLAVAVAATVFCAAAAGGSSAGGAGDVTTVKIVADLPLRGAVRDQTTQILRAIRFVLAQDGYKAGKYRIELESHDDASASRGAWDERLCASNARGYAADKMVVGVIGPFNSGCSAVAIPILNRVALAMVSPTNTYAGLTKRTIATDPEEPGVYYPAGGRNFTRVSTSDDNQGRIGATYMKQTLRAKRVFVLNDRSIYGRMTAGVFEETAKAIGLRVVGHDGWGRESASYRELMARIKASGADAIYLGGELSSNGVQLLRDKRAVLGSQSKVKVLATDGFMYAGFLRVGAPAAADGIVATAATAPAEELGGAAAGFVRAFAEAEGSEPIHDWTVNAAAATQVLLDAIARSNGTRTDVVAKLFATNRAKTVLGPMSFDGNGDPKWPAEALYQAKGGHWTYLGSRSYESTVKPGLVAGSRGALRSKPTRKAHEAWFAPSLPKGARFKGESMRHTRLSDAAYELSKSIGTPKTANVACWSTLDWPRVSEEDDDTYSTSGIWLWDMPHWLHLSPRICRAMETLLHHRPAYANIYTADAVDTVAHELMHALGIEREAQAECFAMQVSATLATSLGVPRSYAMRLSHLNLENYANLSREYVDRQRCREDGVWDLKKGEDSPPWHTG